MPSSQRRRDSPAGSLQTVKRARRRARSGDGDTKRDRGVPACEIARRENIFRARDAGASAEDRCNGAGKFLIILHVNLRVAPQRSSPRKKNEGGQSPLQIEKTKNPGAASSEATIPSRHF